MPPHSLSNFKIRMYCVLLMVLIVFIQEIIDLTQTMGHML